MTKHDRDEVMEKLNGRTVVCSISGGKDSTAMALYLTRDLGIPDVRFVFADTGWEHPDTYSYIREVLTPLLGHIAWVGYPGGMQALVRQREMFPTRLRRFCTDELKMKPIARYISNVQDDGEEVVSAAGVRAAESAARAKMPEWEWSDGLDCEVWRPLITWSEQDVIQMHQRHGVAPNPLYLKGAGVARVGCWPCIHSRKSEIRKISEMTPEVIDTIRHLEELVAIGVSRKIKERGETLDGQLPTFFYGTNGYTPIDEVVAWSKTAHGGKQTELFAPETEPGCVRWGMCSTYSDNEEAA